jgi:hypothetical protein
VHKKQSINLTFLASFMFFGLLTGIIALYFLAEHWLIIAFAVLAHVAFFTGLIVYELKERRVRSKLNGNGPKLPRSISRNFKLTFRSRIGRTLH